MDLRTVSFDVPPQEVSRRFHVGKKHRDERITISRDTFKILSRDSVTVSVDAVVYFNVIDAEQALCSVDDFRLDRQRERGGGERVCVPFDGV